MFKKDQWHEIDTENLTGANAKAYKAYKDANKVMRDLRTVVEDMIAAAVADDIPEGLEARFAHRWGKMSVSACDPRPKGKGGAKVSI